MASDAPAIDLRLLGQFNHVVPLTVPKRGGVLDQGNTLLRSVGGAGTKVAAVIDGAAVQVAGR